MSTSARGWLGLPGPVAVTYEAMGLLPEGRRPNWYDPGRFWSGDDLALRGGAHLGAEIEVRIPPR